MSSQAPAIPAGPALFRLDERVAVITGAGGAFGRATALGFVRAGAQVVLTDLDATALDETRRVVEAEGECLTLVGDASDDAFVRATFLAADRAWGRLDVLVNNAGINPHQAASEDYPLDVWDRVLRVNLTGYLLHAKEAARLMTRDRRGGSIVNVSSISGASALGRGNLAFGVSKAGVDQLTRELAVEWAPRGIRVNSILPCQFLNAGLRGLVTDPARKRTVDRMIGGIPVGRMGEPEEVVGPILFLASPASSMVTGVNLPVDGGNLAFNAGGSLPEMDATW
ncbi:MAG: SDR family oxidoreductase [Chloroflexi bacterium]|nr:SDR family oxidoreductase [Chloroflexota bacterium]